MSSPAGTSKNGNHPHGIRPNRLKETFIQLVQIDSISLEEGELCRFLQSRLEHLGADTFVDRAGPKIGGNSGNLIARLDGAIDVPPLLICAHMDTVEPGRGVHVDFSRGRFRSRGDTVLGADDKSAIAIILEMVCALREDARSHGPLELVFTVGEEVGLLGAKHLDHRVLKARFGYVLDTSDTDGLVTRAPASNQIGCQVLGLAAHAGAEPERGINAISLASKAIAGLKLGRLDDETTCNIGLIQGGCATNIVPEKVQVKGEVRSHDTTKLERVTQNILEAFKSTIADYPTRGTPAERPQLKTTVEREFDALRIADDHAVVELAREAAQRLGRRLTTKTSGGGSDANVFFPKGIVAGILGTGMQDVHTVRESVELVEMVRAAELLEEIVRLHSRRNSC